MPNLNRRGGRPLGEVDSAQIRLVLVSIDIHLVLLNVAFDAFTDPRAIIFSACDY